MTGRTLLLLAVLDAIRPMITWVLYPAQVKPLIIIAGLPLAFGVLAIAQEGFMRHMFVKEAAGVKEKQQDLMECSKCASVAL